MWQVLRQMGLGAEKRSLYARERDTEENQRRRQAFQETLRGIAPERLIFLDERGVTTQMTRAMPVPVAGSGLPRPLRRVIGRY